MQFAQYYEYSKKKGSIIADRCVLDGLAYTQTVLENFDDNDFKILQQLFPEVSDQKSSKEDLVNQLNRVTLDVDKNSFLIAPSSRRENEYFNFVYRWFILELKNLNL